MDAAQLILGIQLGVSRGIVEGCFRHVDSDAACEELSHSKSRYRISATRLQVNLVHLHLPLNSVLYNVLYLSFGILEHYCP
jgi:hypothetical protein